MMNFAGTRTHILNSASTL